MESDEEDRILLEMEKELEKKRLELEMKIQIKRNKKEQDLKKEEKIKRKEELRQSLTKMTAQLSELELEDNVEENVDGGKINSEVNNENDKSLVAIGFKQSIAGMENQFDNKHEETIIDTAKIRRLVMTIESMGGNVLR